jgi:hypothetical protein
MVVAAGALRPTRLVNLSHQRIVMVVAIGALRPARLVKPSQ